MFYMRFPQLNVKISFYEEPEYVSDQFPTILQIPTVF
jgi:hypothetical protein